MSILFERYIQRWKSEVVAEIGPGGAIGEATRAVRSTVLLRTSRGIGADGRQFKKYSKGHKRRRKKAGLRTSVVDLRFTSEMLEDWIEKPVGRSWGTERIEAEIGFASREMEARANFHVSPAPRRKIPLRNPFGLTPEEEAVIAARFFSRVESRRPVDRRERIKIVVFIMRGTR